MKKSVLYEIAAVTLMMVGAVLLVFVFYPNINPTQYRLDNHRENAPISRYLVGTPVSILILIIAWCFNRRAANLRKERTDAIEFG
jgi:hypothetical protein